jgi:hypothetical protein
VTPELLETTDRDFCRAIAAEFRAAGLDESARAWSELARRVTSELAGVHVGFTWLDVQLVAALNVAVFKDLRAPGAEDKARGLYRLGVRIVTAEVAAHG